MDLRHSRVIILDISKSLDLTPAESLMLLGAGWSSSWKMVVVTFADLLMKKVIEIRPLRYNGRFPRTLEICVRPGQNYGLLDRLKPHEKALAKCIRIEKQPNQYCLNYDCQYRCRKNKKCIPPDEGQHWIELRTASENFRNTEVGIVWNYKLGFVESLLHEEDYLRKESKKLFSIDLYYSYPLTEKGQKTQAIIKRLMSDGVQNLERWVEEEPERARAYFDVCGGNMLLLQEHFDMKTIINWSRIVSHDITVFERDAQSDYDYWYDYTWREYDLDKARDRIAEGLPASSRRDFMSLDIGFLEAFNSFKEFERAFKNSWKGPDDGYTMGG